MAAKKKSDFYLADSINNLIAREIQSGDFTCDLPSHEGDAECRRLFLNLYDDARIRRKFEEIGLAAHLKNKGFSKLQIEISRDMNSVSYLKLYDKALSPDNLLLEARFSETLFTPFAEFCDVVDSNKPCTFQMIVIEWLEALDPQARFTDEKPQLPGQKKPGLGALVYIKKFLKALGKEVSRDGFMKIADHIHAAIMYSDIFMFVNPARQGYLNALRRDMEKYTLSDIAWGFVTETIYDRETGAPEKFLPSEQVLPSSDRLMEHFTSRKYAHGVREVYENKGFKFDRERMHVLKKDWLNKNKLEEA